MKKLYEEIEKRLALGSLILAIDGASASGKTTLAARLQERYGAAVFHTDDFFLRPEQRTPERLAEPGGNMDRERFSEEVLLPLSRGEQVVYRPYDCGRQALAPSVTVKPRRLTVVEGAYSLHPELVSYYDLSVFLRIDPALQQKRILKRNPDKAERFFREWIPMEQRYFEATKIEERADILLDTPMAE